MDIKTITLINRAIDRRIKLLNLLNKHIRLFIRMGPPTSEKSARYLLARLRYYHDFIPNFNENTKHIKETIATNSTFIWSAEAQEDLDFIQWIFDKIHQKHIAERNRHG